MNVARALGYIVVGVNDYYTLKKCLTCEEFVGLTGYQSHRTGFATTYRFNARGEPQRRAWLVVELSLSPRPLVDSPKTTTAIKKLVEIRKYREAKQMLDVVQEVRRE
ncbi:hypothetical protein EDD21DRAFT_407259 [Dissophora ornata]|nr:hypothetical protein EDD21DRAFT_407259 [Dissophora ornata]